ncbi:hypothetical protein CEXT_534851 [Caerostris extrusa]|uniref:Uncharacterized protein n=1 Tax=Caerostris extrusa TaxID=172846 RepID=A0AAV4XT09_CAEEX|nr:hypothetical protein CEXT_534851 [Caerostris extrusa]
MRGGVKDYYRAKDGFYGIFLSKGGWPINLARVSIPPIPLCLLWQDIFAPSTTDRNGEPGLSPPFLLTWRNLSLVTQIPMFLIAPPQLHPSPPPDMGKRWDQGSNGYRSGLQLLRSP